MVLIYRNGTSLQSLGGKAWGATQKQRAIDGYNLSPNYCRHCLEPMPLNGARPSQVRKKRFCSMSCAGYENNNLRVINLNKTFRIRNCTSCGAVIQHERNKKSFPKRCPDCRTTSAERLLNTTRADANRGYIGSMARKELLRSGRPQACEECGYDVHVEACHVVAIADFPLTATIREINAPSNLKWLCPNHHWEHDRKCGITNRTAKKSGKLGIGEPKGL